MYVYELASPRASTYLFKSKSPLGFHKPSFTLGSGTSPPVSSITNTKSLSFLTSFSHPQKDLYGRRERRNVNNYTEKEVVCHTELHSPNGFHPLIDVRALFCSTFAFLDILTPPKAYLCSTSDLWGV